MNKIENFGISRVVNVLEDQDENLYHEIIYVLAHIEDGEFIENESEMFAFVIREEDNLLVENHNDLDLEFLDVYEEQTYLFNELETLFAEDVKEYGESLSTYIKINEIKETCINHIEKKEDE